MIEVLAIVFIFGCAAFGYWISGDYAADVQDWHDHRAKRKLRQDLLRADRAIDAEARAAKRAMNDAAGQSWRNLADGGPCG